MFVCVLVNASAAGAVIVVGIADETQLLASFIFIWYVPAAKPVNTFDACQVLPLSFEYCFVPVPPAAVTVIAPSVADGQEICAPL